MHFVKNLWQIRRDTCNFYITFIFRSVPTWRLPKNRQNLTFQISILLHTRNASFQCLSWLSEPCAVLASSSSTLPHVAHHAEAWEALLVPTHSTLWYVICFVQDGQQDHQKQPSLFAGLFEFTTNTGGTKPDKGRRENAAVLAGPGALLRKASCLFATYPS